MSDETENSQDEMADDWGAALAEQASAEEAEAATDSGEAAAEADAVPAQAEQASLENLQADNKGMANSSENLDAILDIPVSLSVEIGQTGISIRNLLQLNQGSVVELDRLAGEPLDIMVNNTLIAHGEVVVVNEKYGIRLTDVISAHERVQNLQ